MRIVALLAVLAIVLVLVYSYFRETVTTMEQAVGTGADSSSGYINDARKSMDAMNDQIRQQQKAVESLLDTEKSR